MTAIKLALVAAALVIATDGVAGTTDKDRYQKIWDRNVTTNLQKPKVGCICLSQGALGALVYPDPGTANTVVCTVPLFDPDGNVLTVVGCTNNYVVLPR
jgi:hypothetical protein